MTETAHNLSSEVVKILKWHEAAELSSRKKLALGQIVSQALAEHDTTMLQYTPEEVGMIIDDRRAVLVVDASEDQLYSFAQLSPWLGRSGKAEAIEFRSWLSTRPGVGGVALRHAVSLSHLRFPGVPLYAVIERHNTAAQNVLTSYGGRAVPMPAAMGVELTAGAVPAAVNTYDLSRIGTEA